MERKKYYLGLDIGTDSVGYAVTDTSENYNLIKFKGEPMWGSCLFEQSNTKAERRAFRSARRRLERRKQRVLLLQEIFAKEVSKVDENFYKRIKNSSLTRDDAQEQYCLFNDIDFIDRDYHKQYPTIHHLIVDLMESHEKRDIRLVYLACAWLLVHRGHFLYDISKDNIDGILNFDVLYADLMNYFESLPIENYVEPWPNIDTNLLANILKEEKNITTKYKDLCTALYNSNKAQKNIDDPDMFPFSKEGILKLLSGGTYKLKDLYGKEEYDEYGSFCLSKNDDEYADIFGKIGDDGELLIKLKAIYDWIILSSILKDSGNSLSKQKVLVYEQHKKDLKFLKYYIKKYNPQKYNLLFRSNIPNTNYVSYVKKPDKNNIGYDKYETCNKEVFLKYLKGIVTENQVIDDIDKEAYMDMLERIDTLTFLPKQVESNNRVIPYQLYYVELKSILDNAAKYYDFLNESNDGKIDNKNKVLSIMEYRIPYYVGPLNKNSTYSWIEKKSNEKIYPWNFDEVVDLDNSEQAFIARMTNNCKYLPGKDVLAKKSLIYQEFSVLNIINLIQIQNQRIPNELKLRIYNELFKNKNKITKKQIKDFIKNNNYSNEKDLETLSGIDDKIGSNLSSYISFKNLLSSQKLTINDIEAIIVRKAYSENKIRFKKYLKENYKLLNDNDINYIANLNLTGFGSLSKELLVEIEGTNKETGETGSIMYFLRNYCVNFMELLSDKYSFVEKINEYKKMYYLVNKSSLEDKLDKMYINNSARRSLLKTIEIVNDVRKATKCDPEKIFIEMARGPEEDKKRSITRKDQILNCYKEIAKEDTIELIKQLKEMGENVDQKLQSRKMFLYFMQLGRCMYTNEPIDLQRLEDGTYNIEHIYPQSKVKDDSLVNNEVLVLSKINGQKSDTYPISSEIRDKMKNFWEYLKNHNLISEEKYKRLIRNTPFTDEEKWGFINRQIVETRQSTKAVASLLQEMYPSTKIVYVKASLVSDFRNKNNILKSRKVNSLHHAKDAYLNIVLGNVYNEKFTKQWFLTHSNDYNLNQEALLRGTIVNNGKTIWNGIQSLHSIISYVQNNNVHLTKYQFCRTGGFFDQNPVKAGDDLVELKKGKPTKIYGGYRKPSISYFIITKYYDKKGSDVVILPIELLYSEALKNGKVTLEEYAKIKIKKSLGIKVEKIEFPFGKRKIKINTIFSLDGFRYFITGNTNGGKTIVLVPFMPLKLTQDSELYIKSLEKINEKIMSKKSVEFDLQSTTVSKDKNLKLYDVFIEKMKNSIYKKRVNCQIDTIINGRNVFEKLDLKDQIIVLLNIIELFGSVSGGCNLQLINGAKSFGATGVLSSKISNWRKNYSTAKIIDTPVSGLWEKETINLFDLL